MADSSVGAVATSGAGSGGGIVERFAQSAAANGFAVHRGAVPEIEGAGVSVGLYGLVESGSVVLAAAPGEPRANSLLPHVHITLLREDRILPGLPELFAAVGERLPSVLAVVSGPSRSADIEQMLALGVHGPREEHIVLLPAGGGAEAAAADAAAATRLTADDFRRDGRARFRPISGGAAGSSGGAAGS